MVAGPYSEHRLWEAVSAARRFARPENLVAGTLGGVVATLMLHPLDLVKIRFAGSMCLLPGTWWHDHRIINNNDDYHHNYHLVFEPRRPDVA